ncbi:MAG: tol-pal system YbgF family protein, partial [Fidelibacterota bacterium]
NYKVPLLSLFILTGCVYFNTFYNAEQSFDKAVKLIDEAADDDELPAVAKDLLKEAFANSEIVVKKYPESKYVDDAFFIMGKSSFFLDDLKNADRYLNRLIYEFPKSSYKEECEIWLTYTHYKMGDEDSALIKINNLLENPPRKKSLKYLLNKTAGEISLSRDSVQSAFLYFEEAAKLADNDSKRMSLYNKMVSISEQSHNYEQTIYLLEQLELYGTTSQIKQEARLKWIEYNRLLGNYNQVLLKIDELLEDPLFAIHHLSLKIEKAKIYLAQKDYSRANDYLKEILEDPSNARKDPTSEAAYLLGNLALTDGFDPELSIMYLDSVTQIIRNSTSRTKANNLKTKVTKYLSLIDELEFAENPIIEENDLIEEQPESPDTILYEIDEIPAFPDNEIEIEKPDIPSVMQVDSLLFTMAEMLLFEFNRPELSMEKYERLVSEFPDSKFAPQSLYVLYKFSEDDKDKWKTLLLDKYPNTDYAHEIEGALTSTEKPGNTLVDLRDLAWLELNDSPQKAADDFEKIAEEHGDPISAFNSAYIYEHYLYTTETAILKYQAFIDEYPDHELNSTATQRLDDIKTAVQVLKNKPVGWVDLFTEMIRIGSVADTLRASTSNNDILF